MSKQRILTTALLGRELTWSTSRSSGPGGQNVNKVNTKVTVKLDVATSEILTPEEKEVITTKLASRLTTDGILVVSAQEKRSQLQNKEAAIQKLEKMLAKAFVKKKPRKATKPSKGAKENRLTQKKQRGETKKWRQKL